MHDDGWMIEGSADGGRRHAANEPRTSTAQTQRTHTDSTFNANKSRILCIIIIIYLGEVFCFYLASQCLWADGSADELINYGHFDSKFWT